MKTLKLRLKDKHAKVLTELAQEANFVWNYGNRLCSTFRKKGVHPKKLPSELQAHTKGCIAKQSKRLTRNYCCECISFPK